MNYQPGFCNDMRTFLLAVAGVIGLATPMLADGAVAGGGKDTGFKRPGSLQLIGKLGDAAAPYFFYSSAFKKFSSQQSGDMDGTVTVNGLGTYNGKASVGFARDVGIKYQSAADRGDGRITCTKFWFYYDKNIFANATRNDFFSKPKASAAVSVSHGGSPASKMWAVSSQFDTTGFSLSIPSLGGFPGASVPVTATTNPNGAKAKGKERLPWQNIVALSIPHHKPGPTYPDGEPFDFTIAMTSGGTLEIYEPFNTSASCDATWNFYIDEGAGQWTAQQALGFKSP